MAKCAPKCFGIDILMTRASKSSQKEQAGKDIMRAVCVLTDELTPKGHLQQGGDHFHYLQTQVASHASAPTDPLG